jgi:hypothetical protein
MKGYVLAFMSFALMFRCQAFAVAKDPATRVQDEKVGARPLDLSSVRLLGGPLKHAQDLDGKYLLELEPDRMLAYYRELAGLEPKAKPYGGWDGGGRNLTGHIAGHYLSAVSLMWSMRCPPTWYKVRKRLRLNSRLAKRVPWQGYSVFA